MPRGTVKWFSEKKGWGFIVDPSVHSDIFVHYSQIQGDGFRTLAEGDEVDSARRRAAPCALSWAGAAWRSRRAEGSSSGREMPRPSRNSVSSSG